MVMKKQYFITLSHSSGDFGICFTAFGNTPEDAMSFLQKFFDVCGISYFRTPSTMEISIEEVNYDYN